jgi:HK97 family phage major capsid protein
MPYNNVTDAGDVGKAIPEQTATEILKNIPQQSAALSLFRTIPLSTRTYNQPVLSSLPMAYFVNGDTGLKQTTELAWANKVMTVEELAVIIPVPQNVIDDMSFDIWGEIRPNIEEAFGRAVDAAIFFGVNKPASWPSDIVTAAVAAGNFVNEVAGDTAVQTVDRISDLWATVEEDGYDVNGMIAPRSMRGTFRKFRDTTGQRLMDFANNTYEGVDVRFVMDGLWPATGDLDATLISGDFTRGIIGLRKDLTYELFREGVITDNSTPPQIIFNLLQQDMVAMRVTMRLAWQVANPINYAQSVEANRYPFGVLRTPDVP